MTNSWNTDQLMEYLVTIWTVRYMVVRHLVYLAVVSTATLSTMSATAGSGDAVEGRIEGVVLVAGRPVQGVRVRFCKDALPARSEKNCNEFDGTWTDGSGHFGFKMRTGYEPPSSGQCQTPFACHGDPGWSYWFVVETINERFDFWTGGLGFGRTYARVVCDLAKGRPRTPAAEPCSVMQEDALEYRK